MPNDKAAVWVPKEERRDTWELHCGTNDAAQRRHSRKVTVEATGAERDNDAPAAGGSPGCLRTQWQRVCPSKELAAYGYTRVPMRQLLLGPQRGAIDSVAMVVPQEGGS